MTTKKIKDKIVILDDIYFGWLELRFGEDNRCSIFGKMSDCISPQERPYWDSKYALATDMFNAWNEKYCK